ncbi:hypothetical protein [Rhizobium sp. BR 362]|uniref:hypothetical protein n=1 Tax=Rhizobium sp. BR 362 TaxID=3040670 RepID=UPI002F42531F
MTGRTFSNYPAQRIYSFAAASRILGRHVSTLFRQAKEGTLKTVDTPLGRRIHVDEIRRQSGEIVDEEPSTQTDIETA